jgi:FkbM family methyltransferase
MKVESIAYSHHTGHDVVIVTEYEKIQNAFGSLLLPKQYLPSYLGGSMNHIAGDVGNLAVGKLLSSHIIKAGLPYLKKGSVILDIGAHMGTMSMMYGSFLSLKGGGEIISMEASPQNYVCTKYNIENNSSENVTNTVLNRVCLSTTTEEKISFPVHNIKTGLITGQYGHIRPEEIHHGYQTLDNQEILIDLVYKVPSISIDSLNLEKVDLIKIDCEGADLEVVAGGLETIGCHKPVLLIEMNNPEKRPQEMKKLISILPAGLIMTPIYKENDWLLRWD